jgi:hypothetical protein
MPLEPGKACSYGRVRGDLSSHDFSGGNAWVQDVVLNLYPGDHLEAAYLQAGKARSISMLERASTMRLSQAGNHLVVRLFNETGHKLPSGYPEGRRMWLHVQVFDTTRAVVAEWGRYDPVEADLDEQGTKVYEILMGMDEAVAQSAGLLPGESFHFVLNNLILKDNRIPPRGFTNQAYQAVQAAPVAAYYADGQYWDDTRFRLPREARSASVTLYYQTASREFIEFLRDENRSNDAGRTLYAQWEMTGRSAPVWMTDGTINVAPFADGDVNEDQRIDYADYASWPACWEGPGAPAGGTHCAELDFDADGDVDLFDWAEFQLAFSGPP